MSTKPISAKAAAILLFISIVVLALIVFPYWLNSLNNVDLQLPGWPYAQQNLYYTLSVSAVSLVLIFAGTLINSSMGVTFGFISSLQQRQILPWFERDRLIESPRALPLLMGRLLAAGLMGCVLLNLSDGIFSPWSAYLLLLLASGLLVILLYPPNNIILVNGLTVAAACFLVVAGTQILIDYAVGNSSAQSRADAVSMTALKYEQPLADAQLTTVPFDTNTSPDYADQVFLSLMGTLAGSSPAFVGEIAGKLGSVDVALFADGKLREQEGKDALHALWVQVITILLPMTLILLAVANNADALVAALLRRRLSDGCCRYLRAVLTTLIALAIICVPFAFSDEQTEDKAYRAFIAEHRADAPVGMAFMDWTIHLAPLSTSMSDLSFDLVAMANQGWQHLKQIPVWDMFSVQPAESSPSVDYAFERIDLVLTTDNSETVMTVSIAGDKTHAFEVYQPGLQVTPGEYVIRFYSDDLQIFYDEIEVTGDKSEFIKAYPLDQAFDIIRGQ